MFHPFLWFQWILRVLRSLPWSLLPNHTNLIDLAVIRVHIVLLVETLLVIISFIIGKKVISIIRIIGMSFILHHDLMVLSILLLLIPSTLPSLLLLSHFFLILLSLIKSLLGYFLFLNLFWVDLPFLKIAWFIKESFFLWVLIFKWIIAIDNSTVIWVFIKLLVGLLIKLFISIFIWVHGFFITVFVFDPAHFLVSFEFNLLFSLHTTDKPCIIGLNSLF